MDIHQFRKRMRQQATDRQQEVQAAGFRFILVVLALVAFFLALLRILAYWLSTKQIEPGPSRGARGGLSAMATNHSISLANLRQQVSHRIEIMHHLTSSLANLEVGMGSNGH